MTEDAEVVEVGRMVEEGVVRAGEGVELEGAWLSDELMILTAKWTVSRGSKGEAKKSYLIGVKEIANLISEIHKI